MDLVLDLQKTTAVERFAELHDENTLPLQSKYYRELLPASPPGPGQQYAFEVDLDSCTGCKACVTACHNLNGLDDGELWRNVGQVHGGSSSLPVMQHVTSACHHCVSPGCLEGCPVNAYEKDPVTGIVRHLDDQCIGCQYCILKCPYDVPKYSPAKGIVRKCDMCSQRLKVGEAPACVQACPNQAISIAVVDKIAVQASASAGTFVACAPEPSYTQPTTVYKTTRSLPANLQAADRYTIRPQHGHLPLVAMLVLTQMSVGAMVVQQVMAGVALWKGYPVPATVLAVQLVATLIAGLIGMNASLLHLGRPQYAFRALLGLRTSWLSREILTIGLYAGAASAATGVACLPYLPFVGQWASLLPSFAASGSIAGAVFMGLVGVFCSTMIYVDTHRQFWKFAIAAPKFFGTALVLGIASTLAVGAVASAGLHAPVAATVGRALCVALIVATVAKLTFECRILVHLGNGEQTPLKGTAQLLMGVLRGIFSARLALGTIGGVALPMAMIVGVPTIFAAPVAVVLLLGGELLERYLFFSAVVAPKMPGPPV